jgi:hypothetical protein
MRSAGFFFFGVSVGVIGLSMVRRIKEVLSYDDPDTVLERINHQVKILDQRLGNSSS